MLSPQQRIENALQFEGMTTKAGLAIMDILIVEAVARQPLGAFIEFGTFKGRTSALIAHHLSPERWLHAVERADYLEIDRIKHISNHVTWHREKSEDFCKQQLPKLDTRIIASHHDASHFFNNVFIELQTCAPFMHPKGIMILDDFNDYYSQVRAAYYYARYARNFPFEILLLAFNKCFLVHQSVFEEYEEFILDSLLDRTGMYGFSNWHLARTEAHEKSRAFAISAKPRPSDPDRYGINFFGERFYSRCPKLNRIDACDM